MNHPPPGGYPPGNPYPPQGYPPPQPQQGYPQPGYAPQPQQPYGAPQQPAAFGAPGFQSPAPVQTGVASEGGGIMADLSSGALMSAVFAGKGFHSPRLLGAANMGLSIVLTIANFVLIFATNTYYPYLFAVGAILGCGGLWLVVTGQPRVNPDGSQAPLWSRLGLGAACILGVLIGLGLIALAHFG